MIYVFFFQDVTCEMQVKDLEDLIPRVQRMALDAEEAHRYKQVGHYWMTGFVQCINPIFSFISDIVFPPYIAVAVHRWRPFANSI